MLDVEKLIAHSVQPSRTDSIKQINFTPTLTGLTEVGTVTKSGSIRVIGDLVFFTIKLAPAALSSLASTLSTTYVSNLPYTAAESSGAFVQDITNLASLGSAIVQSATTRLYLPTISATADTVSINGWYLKAN